MSGSSPYLASPIDHTSSVGHASSADHASSVGHASTLADTSIPSIESSLGHQTFSDAMHESEATGPGFIDKIAVTNLRSLEILLFERGSPQIFDQELTVRMRDWIDRTGPFAYPGHPEDGSPRGGLRLLYWSQTDHPPQRYLVDGTDGFGSPNPSYCSLHIDTLFEHLGLPKESLADFVHIRQQPTGYVPLRVQQMPAKAITCFTSVSPRMRNFLQYALAHDASSGITTGVLICKQVAESPTNDLVSDAKRLKSLAGQPFLVPCFAFSAWSKILSNQHANAHTALRTEIQEETGQMKAYLKSHRRAAMTNAPVQPATYEDIQQRHDKIHQALVTQHAYLSNALPYFVKDLGKATSDCIDKAKESKTVPCQDDMRAYTQRLIARTEVELNHRTQLLDKLDIQRQVLYTLMQQRDSAVNIEIAQATKTDGSAMKTLALITTVFLPTTAIAAIFSMTTFISPTSDGSRIETSPHFWIFWAIVGPLTVVLLTLWILWTKRRWLLSRTRTKKPDRGPHGVDDEEAFVEGGDFEDDDIDSETSSIRN